MKKQLLTYVLLVNSLFALGQASEIAIAPTENFQFGGASLYHYGVGFHQYLGETNLYGSGFYGVNFFTEGQNRLRIARNGNVGIGTTDAVSKLTIVSNTTTGDLHNRTSILLRNTNQTCGDGSTTYNLASYLAEAGVVRSIFESRYDNGYVYGAVGTSTNHDFIIFTGSHEKIRFLSNGNVGIGTQTPNYKLEVNGTIRAKEIKVEAINWPDYVFADNYNLKSLDEVEQFINQNKHLPDILPASQMEAEGVNLSEMNIMMLQKIEELTLYVIELKKEIDNLKNQPNEDAK